MWISAEQRLGLGSARERDLGADCTFRAACAGAGTGSAGALRSRLYAAKAVREEHSADDGSIELVVELPDVELLILARTAGVQILEAPAADMPCASGDAYLQSTAVSGAP